MNEKLGDFQVAFQKAEKLTSNSSMEIIKPRKEISQQFGTVAAALWKYASSISSPEEFLKCISKGDETHLLILLCENNKSIYCDFSVNYWIKEGCGSIMSVTAPSVWHCGNLLGSLSLCEGHPIPPWFPPESAVCFLFVFLLNYHCMPSTSPNVLSCIIQLKRCFTSTSVLRCGSLK